MSEPKQSSSKPKEEEEELKKIFENSQATFNEDPVRWLSLIRDKLFSMFRSPMKEEYSHEAFRWVSQLCMTVDDFSWVTTGDKWTQDEAKIFACIARLSLAEIDILLPLLQRHLTWGDESEMEEGKVVARSANQEDYDRFGTHLVIIESVIKSLVKDQADEDDNEDAMLNPVTDAITSDSLENLLEKFKETMASICDYLETVHRHWQDVIIKDMKSDKFLSAKGALRIICVWLSEDPGCFEPQCKRFLIDLMIKNFLLDDKSSLNDLTILALHSICAESDDIVEACKQMSNLKEVLEKYLKYVEKQHRKSTDRRAQKVFKLRCGLVKDLANKVNDNQG